MNLDKFSGIQGAFLSAQKSIGLLNNITKDEKAKLDIINTKVGKAVKNAKLSNVDFENLFLLLFVNTDTELYQQLKSDAKCSHIVGYLPTISKCLLLQSISLLELQQFFYNAIIFTEGNLCQQFFNLSLLYLKQCDGFKLVSFFENVAKAILDKLMLSAGIDAEFNFKILLKEFESRLEDQKNKWEITEKTKIFHMDGLVVFSLLSLLTQFMKHIVENNYKPTGETIDQDPIFDLFSNLNNVQMTNSENSEINKKLILSNVCESLIIKCFEKLSCVTIDVYLYWAEIELDDEPDTLQRKVAELAYKCQSVLLKVKELEINSSNLSNLKTCLVNIASEPQNKEEPINVTTILQRVNDDGTVPEGLLEKLLSTSFDFTPVITDIFLKNMHYLNSECRKKVFEKGLNYVHTNISDCDETVKLLVLEVVKQETLDVQLKLLSDFVQNYGLIKMLSLSDFVEQRINFFNKVAKSETEDNKIYPDIIILALQDCEAVVDSAMYQGVTSELQGQLMADILIFVKCVCCIPTSTENKESFLLLDKVNKLLQDVTSLADSCKQNCPLFVDKLVKSSLIDGSSLVTNTILPTLKSNKSQDTAVFALGIDVIMCLVKSGLKVKDLDLLVTLIDVLQQSRCGSFYSYDKISVCEKAIALINLLIGVYKAEGWSFSATEEEELKIELTQYRQMNVGHLFRLFSENTLPSDGDFCERLFHMIHVGSSELNVMEMTSEQTKEFTAVMSAELVRLTRTEWEQVFNTFAPTNESFVKLFMMMSSSVLLLKSKAHLCLDAVQDSLVYCCLTSGYIINQNMFKWDQFDAAVVFVRFCTLFNELQHPQQEQCSATVMNILKDLIKVICKNKPIAKDVINLIMSGIFSIKLAHVRKAVGSSYVESINQI